jgi:hypothetical protein
MLSERSLDAVIVFAFLIGLYLSSAQFAGRMPFSNCLNQSEGLHVATGAKLTTLFENTYLS